MSQRGFRPARKLSGGCKFRSRPYPVNANNPKDLFVGHAVVLSSGNIVEATSTGTDPILGVIKATYTGTKNRPRTHESSPVRVPASTAAFVDVIDDPDVVFSIEVDGTASAAMVGQVIDIAASQSGNATTGQSGMYLQASTIAAPTSANFQTLPFRIVAAPSDLERGVAASGNRVDVIINSHQFKLVSK